MLYFLRKSYPKATNMNKAIPPVIYKFEFDSDTLGKANNTTRNELLPQHSRDLTTSHTSYQLGQTGDDSDCI